MPRNENWATVGTYSHLGITLAVMVLAFFFGGYWLDGKLGTKPLLSIVGAFIGAAGGFFNLVYTLMRLQKNSEDDLSKTDEDK